MRVPFVLLLSCVFCDCYDILVAFAHGSYSHFVGYERLLLELTERGHNVTLMSQFGVRDARKNYREIQVKTDQLLRIEDVDLLSHRFQSELYRYITPKYIQMYIEEECSMFSNKNVQMFLKGNETFDLILIEDFGNDCLLGLVHHFKTPFISLTSCDFLPWSGRRNGNPMNPAYVPNLFLKHSDKLSFLERLDNTVFTALHQMYNEYIMLPLADRIARKYFGEDLPPLKDLAAKNSLSLINSHFTINTPRPLVPALVQVGGIHIPKKGKLPKDIEKWIEGSPKGVIYFSMGSMIKGHTFPDEKKKAFLKAFSRLGQRVLWKWENETMPGKPDNVMIQKWMPQLDVLCHPNVKAFISHGGLLGTTEAVHCGVPAVVMPQFGDQFTNARALEASGGGVVLNFRDVNEDSVYNAIKTVLDPEFNKKAKELSERFRDRPMPPLETAIYWIEYVARHKGAHHMRTAAVGMPFYQYLLLDVIAFLAVIVLLSAYISWKVTKFLFKKLFGKTRKVKEN